jgi:hypothetical protein
MTVFPRICAKKSKERAINRILSSPLIDVEEVMSYYISEVVKKNIEEGKNRRAHDGSKSDSRRSAMSDDFATFWGACDSDFVES